MRDFRDGNAVTGEKFSVCSCDNDERKKYGEGKGEALARHSELFSTTITTTTTSSDTGTIL